MGVPGAGDLLGRWAVEPGVVVGAVVALGLYGWGVARAAAAGRSWPVARSVAFCLGVAATVVALCSGLDAWADELLSVHMVQHLALTLVAAPLLVAGAPIALALRALPRGGARRLVRAMRSHAVRILTHPLVAWTLFAAVLLGTHLTGLYELAPRHPAAHDAEHLAFLDAAILFWLPVLGAEPLPHRPGWTGRMLYLLLAMPAMALPGVILSGARTVRYPSYLEPAHALGVSALADQRAAGAIMWVAGSALAALLTLAVAWSALIAEERRTLAREARLGGAR